MIIRRAILRVAAVVALIVVATGVGVASPAQAAPKPIGLSIDGTTYTDQLTTSLFAGALIVPGGTITRSFWVKNRTAFAGNLAVAVQDVTGANGAMIAALSLRADSGTQNGAYVGFSSVNPCRSLLSALNMPAGDETRVDVTLKLSSSLTHLTSQSSVGAFKVRVVLTSTDVAAPDGCAASTPVTPPPGGGHPDPTPPGTIDTALLWGNAEGTVLPTLAEGPLSGLGGDGSVRSVSVIPNTGRFWQELDVTGYLIAMVLGGIFAWWRRRRPYEEEAYA